MTRQVYVGNLAHDTTPDTLRTAFSRDGRNVSNVVLVKDHRTGRSRGFGFVEMSTEDEAVLAIRDLDGVVIDGRPIKVKEGKERPEFRVRAAEPSSGRGGRGGGGRRR
jgi:RNA recognition motif-containing protein